jgi:hypothetical protein
MKTAIARAALLLAIPGGSWRVVPGLEGGRYAPTATLLASGGGTDTVLVVGGYRSDTEECQRSAQLFDSATGRFTPTGSLAVGRNFHTATRLEDGRVLIAGGFHTRLGSLASAELYDPRSGVFTSTGGSLTVPRELYTATRLPDGRVLLVGGFDTHSRRTLASAEVYDPGSGRFTRTPGSMAVSRFGHDALWIPSLKKVLIAGGKQHDQYTGREWRALDGAELFDPETGQFTPLPPMRHRRDRPTLGLLPDGRILIAGGKDDESTEKPREAEIFDPARLSIVDFGLRMRGNGFRRNTEASEGHGGHGADRAGRDGRAPTSPLLRNSVNSVAVLPGARVSALPTPSAGVGKTRREERSGSPRLSLVPRAKATPSVAPLPVPRLRDPSVFLPAASLQQDRFAHQAVTLGDGRILLLGGWSDSVQGTTPASELYHPSTGAFELTRDRDGKASPMTVSRLDAGAVYLPAANRVLVVGGQRQDAASENRPVSVDSAELYVVE